MEQNESNLSFDQLPRAVGELLTKVDYVISRLDEKKEADSSSPTSDDDQMMTMDEACQFIGKKRSTMYSLTSERRIPIPQAWQQALLLQEGTCGMDSERRGIRQALYALRAGTGRVRCPSGADA